MHLTVVYRFLLALVGSAALMMVDHQSTLLAPVRLVGSVVVLPFQWAVGVPEAVRQEVTAYYPDDELSRQYQELHDEHTRLAARLQRYEWLETENRRLAGLLGISREFGERALLAEIVEIGLDDFAHRIALNHGQEAGVYLGQPVITPQGVLGQVSGVGVKRSVVTLITHPSHGLPVQIQRNGLRTIVRGDGTAGQVTVPFLSSQADVRRGDVLVTSGLGGGFPPGYRVAQVQEVVADADAPFLSVRARTFANIGVVREALLLWGEAVVVAPHGGVRPR